MTEKELMLSEQLYIACDEELAKDNATSRKLTRLINTATEEQAEYRKQLFRELFQTIGENFWIEPPFRCDYGCHISIGENFYANFDCIMLDVCDIVIGDNVFFGPRVCVYTAGHPIDAEIRNMQLEYGKKVSIGSNVVIGSGSVVTKDIPDNVIAVGNPCRILREITQEDKRYWEEQAEQYKKNKGR